VLVLKGGPDAEREVSLNSGAEVAAALRRSGRFSVIEEAIHRPSLDDLRAMGGDVVFPVLHGQWGEGGPLQALLDQLEMPYVGSTPRAAALAMDKFATKQILAADGLPTPPAQVLSPHDRCELDPPLVLKPVDDGSSVDLRICRTREQVEQARAELHPRRGRMLAERYIRGRELTVGIVLDRALPIIEIVPPPSATFYDYHAKYHSDETSYVVNPTLPVPIAEQCVGIALHAFRRIGGRDLARVDIMLDERGPWFLEINTMPGFTTHSLVPMAARETGMDMLELCADLVAAALARHERRAVPAGSR
jgi:D-alanine-D-alanine ligase